ncbi:hypothetical protein ACFL49_03385 [Candidatus Omnitrophota bacterium]
MLFLTKMKTKKGQSIVEYSLLMIFVMTALFMMGNYIKNSWHAQVKTLEWSANQSRLEDIPQPRL